MTPNTKKVFCQATILGLIALVVTLALAPAPTSYDYFWRLAQAFTKKRLFLTESPPWLNELIPAGDSRYYVPYPPMPAILLTPLVLLKIPVNQTLLANLLGALNLSLSFLLIRMVTPKTGPFRRSWEPALLMSLFLGLSTPHFFLASVGSAWYLAQVAATTFLLLAAISALKKSALLAGIFLGAAYWSRLPTILTAPLLLLLLLSGNRLFPKTQLKQERQSKKLNGFICFALGVSVFIILNGLYNWARFGVPWDIGYTLIPNVLAEPWYQKGVFHPSYLKRHLRVLFLGLPSRRDTFPYFIPSWSGMAIWLTTPAAVLALLAPARNLLTPVSWITLLLTLLPSLLHGTTGFSQFGYRFAVDAILPLFFLVYLGVLRAPRILTWLLIGSGIAVNLWGALLINRLGLAGW